MGFRTSYWQKEPWSHRAAGTLTSYALCWNPNLGNGDVNYGMLSQSLRDIAQGRDAHSNQHVHDAGNRERVVSSRCGMTRSRGYMHERLKNYALAICLFVFLFAVIGNDLHLSPGGSFVAALSGTPLVIFAFSRRRRCTPSSRDSATMLSHSFSRSTAIRRNSFGYRPTRFFATCSSFPCAVCLFRVSHFWGSLHMARS